MSLVDRIHSDFTYHSPSELAIENMQQLRMAAHELALLFDAWVPQGRELSLALTNLEQAIMWANAGIVRNQDA